MQNNAILQEKIGKLSTFYLKIRIAQGINGSFFKLFTLSCIVKIILHCYIFDLSFIFITCSVMAYFSVLFLYVGCEIGRWWERIAVDMFHLF